MEQGITRNNTVEINNIDNINTGVEYVITRNNTNDVVISEQTPIIGGLESIQQNNRYQLTRNEDDEVEVIENNNVDIPSPSSTSILTYGIRRNDTDYSLTRIGAFNEFVFTTNNATIGEEFNILKQNGSRIAYVFTASCKIIKFGLLHVSNFRT